MYIYCVENLVNGKKYVGQTRNSVNRRIRDHKKSPYLLGKAFKKYGENSFKVSILDTAMSLDELNSKESKYITELNTIDPEGYNLDSGGKEKCASFSTRIKISLATKKYKNLPFRCQIMKRADTGSYRLRVTTHANKRISLGSYKSLKSAIKYYKKWAAGRVKSVVVPEIDYQQAREKYRLRLYQNGKRITLGHFDTKQQAYTFYYR